MLHTAPSILCVTDRTLCPEHFLSQISCIAAAGPAGVILRKKDLCESAYRSLAAQVLSLCRQHQVPCILHTFPPPPWALGATALHLPCPFCAPCPRRNALPSPPWVPPAIPLRRPWRPRHWGPPIFWPDIFLTPAASRACPAGIGFPGPGLRRCPPACLRHWRHHGGNSPRVRRAGARAPVFGAAL